MLAYLLRRIVALFPTLVGITVVSFFMINLAPGGPVEQKLLQIRMKAMEGGGGAHGGGSDSGGITQEMIDQLNKHYGFDKPVAQRYWIWLTNLATLDFGKSFSFEEPVIDVIRRKLPVSMTFGILSFLLSYVVCIPLGIFKAVRHGSKIDTATSTVLFFAYSTPPFILGILLIVFLGGGSFLDLFPISGFQSDQYDELTTWGKFVDRAHHMALPLVCYMIGHFTTLTVLMKNSFLEEIRKDYVRTARAKGLSERSVMYKHALRNALIPIATGFSEIVTVFFAGSILIETIFSLDGMGSLSFHSILSRDYNVVMGLLVIQSFLYLLGNILSDVLYIAVDPRLDFRGNT